MPRSFVVLVLLLTAGCSGLLKAPPPVTLWRLDAPQTPAATAPVTAPTPQTISLRVESPIARAGHEGTGMAYAQGPAAIDYYASNRWVAPPAQMFGEALTTALQDSRAYRAVIGPASPLPADYSLHSELLTLTHSLHDGPPQVRLGLHLSLTANPAQRVLASRQIDVRQPLEENTAAGYALAANRALQLALRQTLAFCAEQLAE